jgi:predicted nuclease of predicted toxin-antitoxin system
VTFIIDAQLPPSLASALREKGWDTIAVRDIGLRDATDAAIWDYALANGCGIITKDEDFMERFLRSKQQPTIIWLRIGNSTNAALVAWLTPLLSGILARIGAGDILIEVR